MAYTTITITTPSSAEKGKKVSVSVTIKNVSLYGASFRAEISAIPDYYSEFLIGTIEKFLDPKESMTRSGSFTMRDCNTTISVSVWSWEFNYVTHVYAWMYAGSASKVVRLEIPVPETFHLSVLVPTWAAGGYVQPGSGDYPAYSTVKLTAYPLSGYQFVSWGGDASGTSLTFNLYMDSDKYVEAYFEKVPVPETFHLSVYVPPWAAGGYVEPGSGDYPANETITLTAHPLDGYQFTGWGGDASGTSLTYNLYMNSDKNVEAYFEKVPVPEFAGKIITKELKYDETRGAIPVY